MLANMVRSMVDSVEWQSRGGIELQQTRNHPDQRLLRMRRSSALARPLPAFSLPRSPPLLPAAPVLPLPGPPRILLAGAFLPAGWASGSWAGSATFSLLGPAAACAVPPWPAALPAGSLLPALRRRRMLRPSLPLPPASLEPPGSC